MAISKALRKEVQDKFGGLCAYTGKLLDIDWQVDHVKSKTMYEQIKVSDAYFLHQETGNRITVNQYQELQWTEAIKYKHKPATFKPHNSCHLIENLLPCIKIVNHYKRGQDLDLFRRSMISFHERLKKLPKNTLREQTKKRITYMNNIAELFEITVEKPFSGLFYFETLTK